MPLKAVDLGLNDWGNAIVDEMLLVSFGHSRLAEHNLALFREVSYCDAFPISAKAKWSSRWV